MIVGVDPGVTGAIAWFSGNVLCVENMPTYEVTIGRKQRLRVDAVALFNYFEMLRLLGASLVVMESVGGRARQSAAAGFNFGWSAALVYQSCVALSLPIESVTPQTWKKLLKVPGKMSGVDRTADKREQAAQRKANSGAIIHRADELMPEYRSLWRTRRGAVSMDRAEAALLAYYGANYSAKEGITSFKEAMRDFALGAE